jgi:hypothetical protein
VKLTITVVGICQLTKTENLEILCKLCSFPFYCVVLETSLFVKGNSLPFSISKI